MLDQSVDDQGNARCLARARLEEEVKGNTEALRRVNLNKAGWALNLYLQAGEASGSFRSSTPIAPRPLHQKRHLEADSPASALVRESFLREAERSARRQIRRYCALTNSTD